MQGIGPGTVLGGRYTADQRTTEFGDGELWTARDLILDRSVTLVVVSRTHPFVAAFLDAARRVAGLDNARLSRILDVGSDDEVAYVVEESLDGALTLAQLLDSGPLPAPEVRRMAGETSLVLDVARNRGLHHQRLTPQHVLRTQDGDIKLRGLAMLAALAGIDDTPDHEAAREDAKSVVALAYAGFTGLWPLPGDSGGLDPAPRVANHVAAPSEIAASVPADLDALCRLTFANDQGPTTPGDFARQIAPWSPIPILLPTVTTESPVHRDASITAPAAGGLGASQVPARPVNDPEADEPTVARSAPRAEPDQSERDHREPDQNGRDSAPSDGAAPGTSTDVPAKAAESAEAAESAQARDSAETAGAGAAAAAALETSRAVPGPRSDVPVAHRIPSPGPGGAPSTAPRPVSPGTASRPKGRPTPDARADGEPGANLPTPTSGGAGAPLGPSPVAAMGAKTAAALGAAGTATAGAAKALGDRFSDWSAQAKERSKTAAEERQRRREEAAVQRAADEEARAEQAAGTVAEWDQDADVTGSDRAAAVGRPAASTPMGRAAQDQLEPPAPLLPSSAAQPLTRDQSRMAIGIILGFIVLALGLAMWGLSKVPSLPGLPDLSETAVASPPATTDPDADEDGTEVDGGTGEAPAGPDAVSTPGQPLTFTDVVDYDPLGDVEERPEQLPNIIDGDATTFWNSMGYQSTTFSGLKEGMGVVLDLGESSSLSEVTLDLPLANTGRIYVTDDDTYFTERPALADDLEPVGEFTGPGATSVELAEGTAGRYVIVWFTNTVSIGEWHRAQLAGASATS